MMTITNQKIYTDNQQNRTENRTLSKYNTQYYKIIAIYTFKKKFDLIFLIDYNIQLKNFNKLLMIINNGKRKETKRNKTTMRIFIHLKSPANKIKRKINIITTTDIYKIHILLQLVLCYFSPRNILLHIIIINYILFFN